MYSNFFGLPSDFTRGCIIRQALRLYAGNSQHPLPRGGKACLERTSMMCEIQHSLCPFIERSLEGSSQGAAALLTNRHGGQRAAVALKLSSKYRLKLVLILQFLKDGVEHLP